MPNFDSELDSDLDARLALRRKGFALDLAIRIPAHGITAVLGPSGGGKTTLLRLLAGLETPNCGHIRYGPHSWLDTDLGIEVPTRQRRVGFMFQHYALFPHLSVARNIAFGLPRSVDWRAQVAFWLERVGLSPLASRRPGALSGGERQRVALARALAPHPAALLLDEPFSAVDASLRQTLRLLLHELVAETQVPTLLVSHDIDDVRQIADRAAVIIDGELRRFGNTAEVFADPGDAEVARVLGWPNILPIRSRNETSVEGLWGRLPLPAGGSQPAEVVAIRPDGPCLGSAEGLPIQVLRSVDLGRYTACWCRLADGSSLRVHLPDGAPGPAPGEQSRLGVPADAIVALPLRA
ncbi:ABC transporter ATP-binding protein [Thiorhodovibrio frisius]|uniref:ABC-type spermidine/putrescine transport system, ATPase component n=1 Tax=Thiorhodovibrio frisius TaxID=631362 RepID=H8Z613_9GAMM|nr:ATP-binding cassette domain-containing protein [Thiorhodovibrio frisius]EIC20663.1 ABC-type spermidine/putrescine transport system, ATPase component [Thiorhodovibrio frisius]WPL21411.1 Sulfate/thiosulfate import ATP-binding protein CysA [Thiorhodovibrio frisius]